MYAAHPIAMNPFRSAFAEVFLREREMARVEAERGGVNENEQLVWVLWKILKGDGNDVYFLHFCLMAACRADILYYLLIARSVLPYNACAVTPPSEAPRGSTHN